MITRQQAIETKQRMDEAAAYPLEATRMGHCFAVRPKGALGTMGWSPKPWSVVYVPFSMASTPEEAVMRVGRLGRVWG
jgi:hypothetical protein